MNNVKQLALMVVAGFIVLGAAIGWHYYEQGRQAELAKMEFCRDHYEAVLGALTKDYSYEEQLCAIEAYNAAMEKLEAAREAQP